MKATNWKVRTHAAPLFPAHLGSELRPDGVFPWPDGVAVEVNESKPRPGHTRPRGMVLLLTPDEARELARNLKARAAIVDGQARTAARLASHDAKE
jgi:hypothetical protein